MPIGIICNPFQLEFRLATYYKFLLPQNEKRIYQTRALPLVTSLEYHCLSCLQTAIISQHVCGPLWSMEEEWKTVEHGRAVETSGIPRSFMKLKESCILRSSSDIVPSHTSSRLWGMSQ